MASPDPSLQVPATTRVASPDPGLSGSHHPAPADNEKNKDNTIVEKTDEDIIELSNLETPLVPTPVKPPVKKNIIEHEEDTDDELETTFGGEVCTVCKVKFRSVASLQEHILTKHCTQSSQVMELLKMQQQLLNTVLANQAMQEKTLTNIALQQDCVIGDMKDLKQVVISKHVEKQHDSSRGPRSPPLGPPQGTPTAPPQEPLSRRDSYSDRVREEPHTSQQPSNATTAKKIAYMTDSIGGKVHIDLLEKLTKTKIKRSKAYASTKRSKAEGFKFPESNFTDRVPQILAAGDVDVVVTMAPSVELTNLPKNSHHEYATQEASNSSYNMVKVATLALANNNNLQKFIITERAPRFDKWMELNKYANEELYKAAKQVENEEVRRRIFIGKHTLACEDDGLRLSRYGDPNMTFVDGIHLKGSSGPIALTRSMARILAASGLCNSEAAEQVGRSKENISGPSPGYQVQNNRSRPRSAHSSQARPFVLPTHNQFDVLGN